MDILRPLFIATLDQAAPCQSKKYPVLVDNKKFDVLSKDWIPEYQKRTSLRVSKSASMLALSGVFVAQTRASLARRIRSPSPMVHRGAIRLPRTSSDSAG
jgi:hypothetical protein